MWREEIKKAMEVSPDGLPGHLLDFHGECEVPNCSRPAVVVCRLHGGGLCRFHYEKAQKTKAYGIHRWVPIEE